MAKLIDHPGPSKDRHELGLRAAEETSRANELGAAHDPLNAELERMGLDVEAIKPRVGTPEPGVDPGQGSP